MHKKLVELPTKGRAVFVGDTHGDLEASQWVVKKYLDEKTILIFLGDYVDRGPKSKENIDFLLRLKEDYPERVFLLMGNHEAYSIVRFYPADFWEGLSSEESSYYTNIFKELPLAVFSYNGVIALHGALPDVNELSDINKIRLGDDNWYKIVWGDFSNNRGEFFGMRGGRPLFGQDYFERVMGSLGTNVLIRSHQPDAPEKMYNNRCLTIFTSSVYKPERTVALLDLESPIRNVDDILIERF
ncbi:MAG: hypothetical protein DRP15_01030 [Candidatus Aenigmatarchaeota archaeon]|nr:MAG: hypothetical protein DRP15_01030 [Candidatus Aenigmarchaeota archaeon]